MTGAGSLESSAQELKLADEELLAAERMLDLGLARIALTRVYFAAFHAERALLFAEGFEPKSHEGVHHLFNLHFVKTGRFAPATSRLLAKLQKFRESADYAESFVVDVAGARAELGEARAFVEQVRTSRALIAAACAPR